MCLHTEASTAHIGIFYPHVSINQHVFRLAKELQHSTYGLGVWGSPFTFRFGPRARIRNMFSIGLSV